MPAENIWLLAPRVEGTAIKILREARIDAVAANAPPGGSGSMLFVSIRKQLPGDSRDAIHALLSMIRLLKYVVIVDEDVDIYDQEQIDWALAFRHQPDRDIVIHEGARGAPLDPSTESWKLGPGELSTTAKVGIDATIPDRAPRDRFERLVPAFENEVKLADYLD
jgi:2,5-furandicarboxylate decarboxylase 1